MLNQIGNYDIVKVLASGGFATVYQARKPGLATNFALKLISLKQFEQENLGRRVEDEITIHSRLKHPHIVPLLDYGFEGDYAYLVMPLLRGGNLAQRLATCGALKPAEAAKVLNQIADALDYLHQKYIIHLDIKPENILFDEFGKAYLADFGIARDLAAPKSSISEGVVLGSPRYVSPEQLRRQPTSLKSDIYSLGLLMYQTLTGFAPYESQQIQELFKKQLLQPLPELQSRMPDLAPELNLPIIKATKKDPSERYKTVREFAEDFHQVVRLDLFALAD